jgi:hypothetical protein
MTEPKPSFQKTYKRADGEHIDEWGWVTELDYLDDEDEPVELIEETWERVTVRRFWHLPDSFYGCQVEDAAPCEEDAVAWWQTPDGVWLQVCPLHRDRAHRAEGNPQ